MRHTLTILYLIALVIGTTSCAPSGKSTQPDTTVSAVNKTVKQFPAEEDFSTPETAYVAINRIIANGTRADWVRIRPKGFNLPSPKAVEISQDEQNALLNANILEVRMNTKGMAVVISKIDNTANEPFEIRTLILEDGRWVGVSHGRIESKDRARQYAKLRLSKWWPLRYQMNKFFKMISNV